MMALGTNIVTASRLGALYPRTASKALDLQSFEIWGMQSVSVRVLDLSYHYRGCFKRSNGLVDSMRETSWSR